MRLLAEEVKVYELLKPQVATATQTGTGIDLSGSEEDALAILNLGTLAVDGTDTLTVVIQKCTLANGTGAETIGSFTAVTGVSDNKIAAIPVALNDAEKPFIRAVGTIVSGNSASFAFSVTILARQAVLKDSNTSATAA